MVDAVRATDGAAASLPPLDVWYDCDLALCNFACAYCASVDRRSQHEIWAEPGSLDRFLAITGWIARLPYHVRLRLQTAGEPFVAEDFLARAAWLTRQPALSFVELVTNGSLLKQRMARQLAGAAFDRLSLWITFHHTEIAPEALVENARHAADAGAFVIVNALAFPDSLAAIERVAALCRAHGLRFNLDMGYNLNAAYDGDFVPVLALRDPESGALLQRLLGRPVDRLQDELRLTARPLGELCSAGYDYIHVRSDGAVFPCRPYSIPGDRWRLGSALDAEFVPARRTDRDQPCAATGSCVCKEDFLHLARLRQGPRGAPTLGRFNAVG
jgi:MoaA/NifB/PqqE/SkfB family radical SAM enzyme